MSDGAWKVEPAGHGRSSWRIRSTAHPRPLAATAKFGLLRGEAQRVADYLNSPAGFGCVPGHSRLTVQLLEVARPGHAAVVATIQNKATMRNRAQIDPAQTPEEAEADRRNMEAARVTLAELRGPDEPMPEPGSEADIFRCARTACRLMGTACARRWADIDAKARRTRAGICEMTAYQAQLDKCHGCDAGRARAVALGEVRDKPAMVHLLPVGYDYRNVAPMWAP